MADEIALGHAQTIGQNPDQIDLADSPTTLYVADVARFAADSTCQLALRDADTLPDPLQPETELLCGLFSSLWI